jgi:hypothetical protein
LTCADLVCPGLDFHDLPGRDANPVTKLLQGHSLHPAALADPLPDMNIN